MSEISSFKFRRNPGGNSTIKFSDGRRVTVIGGDKNKDTVDIPAYEVTLLSKMDPKQNSLSVFTLVGEGDIAQIASHKRAKDKLEEIMNPPLEKAEGTGFTLEEYGKGWFNVLNTDGQKTNTRGLRKQEAEDLIAGQGVADVPPATTDTGTDTSIDAGAIEEAEDRQDNQGNEES